MWYERQVLIFKSILVIKGELIGHLAFVFGLCVINEFFLFIILADFFFFHSMRIEVVL